MSVFSDQKMFMEACGQTTGTINVDQFNLYRTLIKEEVKEFEEAENHADILKELMDIIVVVVGATHSMGIDPENAWNEVITSNMSKVDVSTGKVLRREDGKILKGPNYIAPDFTKLFEIV